MRGGWCADCQEVRLDDRLAGRVAGSGDLRESPIQCEPLAMDQRVSREEVLGLVAGRGDPSGGPPAADKVDRQQQREERARGRIHQARNCQSAWRKSAPAKRLPRSEPLTLLRPPWRG